MALEFSQNLLPKLPNNMYFSEEERSALLQLKGIGATVITRLEQVGYSSLAMLQDRDAAIVTKQIADLMGSTCWHNSPQARSSIQAAIDLASRVSQSNQDS